MVALVCNASAWAAEAGDCKLKVSLVYMVRSCPQKKKNRQTKKVFKGQDGTECFIAGSETGHRYQEEVVWDGGWTEEWARNLPFLMSIGSWLPKVSMPFTSVLVAPRCALADSVAED